MDVFNPQARRLRFIQRPESRSHPLFDEEYEDNDDERYPFVRGRKPFGRITIAISDAGSTSLLEVAIDEAHRAIHELV
jgi:hypothetical protein